MTREEREEFERDIKNEAEREYYKGFKEEPELTYEEHAEAKAKSNNNTTNKYKRECKGVMIDVYDVLSAFNVVNPAAQHAVKKLLASGQRGYKDVKQDLEEAIVSIERAIELEIK